MKKLFNIGLLVLVFSLLVSPFLASAQLKETKSFFTELLSLVSNVLIPLVFTLALLLFFWGMVKYIYSAGTDKQKAKDIMIWGVIALFVMSSIWAIIYFVSDQLGIQKYEPSLEGKTMMVPNIAI